MVTEDDNVVLTLNIFFSDEVTSLNIPKFKDCNPLYKKIPQPILSAIHKYTNHSSVNTIIKYNKRYQ